MVTETHDAGNGYIVENIPGGQTRVRRPDGSSYVIVNVRRPDGHFVSQTREERPPKQRPGK